MIKMDGTVWTERHTTQVDNYSSDEHHELWRHAMECRKKVDECYLCKKGERFLKI